MAVDYREAARHNRDNAHDDYFIESQAWVVAQKAIARVPSAHEDYYRVKEEFIQTEKFVDVLEKTGFLGVTRGGPELNSCDFIADIAVEALGYAVGFYGSEMVQGQIRYEIGLNFTVDDIPAVRAWICSLVSSKSQAELMKLVGWEFVWKYEDVSLYAQNALNTIFSLEKKMPAVRMTRIAESLHFPNLPKDQAKQFATVLKWWPWYTDEDLDVDDLSRALQDADSLKDVAIRFHAVRVLTRTMQKIYGGRTDTVVQLASSAYQLVMSAEELGLFMLPPN